MLRCQDYIFHTCSLGLFCPLLRVVVSCIKLFHKWKIFFLRYFLYASHPLASCRDRI